LKDRAMDNYYIRTNILIVTAAIPVIFGTYHYRKLDIGTKIFFYLAVFSFIDESVAYYSALHYHNNMFIYNIANIIEVFIVSLYFNATIKFFKERNFGIIIGILSVIFGIINNFFIQSPNGITNYFLFFQALITIAMSIFSLSMFMIHGSGNVKKEVHFWFPAILMFSWSSVYLLFTLVKYYKKGPVVDFAVLALFAVSVITNLAIAVVFWFYPKMYAYER